MVKADQLFFHFGTLKAISDFYHKALTEYAKDNKNTGRIYVVDAHLTFADSFEGSNPLFGFSCVFRHEE